MMYFKGNAFYPFALDWQEQSNERHVVPGLGVYFLHPKEGDWEVEEIERQINFIRRNGLAGEAHYRVKFVTDNTKGVYDLLQSHYYASPALQPPMTWADTIPPTAPTELSVERIADGYTRLRWQAATDNDTLNRPTYVIYASDKTPVDTTDPRNIVEQRIRGTEYIYAPIYPWEEHRYFAVTAQDRYGNESNPSTGVLQSSHKDVSK